MAIVALDKVTLYGPAAEKDAVIEGLQRLGCLHLVDLRPGASQSGEVATSDVGARAALQYLEDSPVRRRPERRAGLDLPAVAKEALEIRDRSRALDEERGQLRRWIAELEPWGDFEVPAWGREGALRLWFYAVPLHQLDRLKDVVAPWRVAARDHRFAYVVVVAAEPPGEMPVAPVSLPPQRLSSLRARIDEVERELGDLDYRRIGLTLHREALADSLDEADDRAARDRAGRVALERDRLFALRGWAPATLVPALRKFASDRRLAVTVEPPGPEDDPPTLLDNPPALRGGEGMVTFYRTPAYRMWDPSRAVFFAFAAFFGMIFSDAGYGLVLGLLTLAGWRRLGRSPGGATLRGVLVALVASSIVYGVLVGSFFGVTPPKGSWLARAHVLDAGDQRQMMLISLGVGVVHLTSANLVAAWERRRTSRALSSLGWALALVAAFVTALAKTTSGLARWASLGFGGLALGGLLVLLFSSDRPLSLAPRAILGRLLDGLHGLTESSKAFGDVLSYLRLFALGLASIKLAEAFNHLAASSFALRGVGILLGLVVLLVGHVINFAMGIMGGVVHGLRLNVIEFFNWSLPEEGALFHAFSRKARA
jgi:V/A-type H+-transporting ATPase subunit I